MEKNKLFYPSKAEYSGYTQYIRMLEILIPSLGIHLYEFYRRKSFSRYCFSDLAITSGWALLYWLSGSPPSIGICAWILTSSTLLLRWYCLFRFRIALSWPHLQFLRHPGSFIDSVKALSLGKPACLAIALICLSLLAFFHSPNPRFWIFFFLLSLLLCFEKPQWLSRKKNTIEAKEKGASFPFPHEISIPISESYPALRKTLAFLGEKEVDIPIMAGQKPHIIFLFLESFRAKNVGCLGAQISASPHFDLWAKKGLLFKNFHANGLQTFRACISTFFGIPGHIQTLSLKPFCSIPLVGLASILESEGYHPAIIQSGALSFDFLYPFFYNHGWKTILGWENIPTQEPPLNSWGLKDETMLRYAADWLQKQTSPTFLSLFTINNHHPWKKPEEWNFEAPKNLPSYYQNYLETFSYTDYCLHLFLQQIEKTQLLKNSIVFIVGDHGCEMGEKEPFSEIHYSLFEESLHLPLLILGNGIKPNVTHKTASFIDFLPTVLDLLNIQATHHGLGNSLLRKTSSPIYFSSPLHPLEFGCIENRKKGFQASGSLFGFDLEKDTEEKIPIPEIAFPLIEKSASFFRKVETLFQSSSWAPKPHTAALAVLKAEELMQDQKWLSHLYNSPPSPILDLSEAKHLTDQAILGAPPSHAAQWMELTFKNTTLLTDRSLNWISRHCKNLLSLNLSHCHLITNEGVKTILSHCSKLLHLSLDGIEDLSDCVPEGIEFSLRECSLKQVSSLSQASFIRLLKNSPRLLQWSAELKHIQDSDLVEVSSFPARHLQISLSSGHYIHDAALTKFLSSQKALQKIRLETFPLITAPDFSQLAHLAYLEISDCPLLSDALFDSLKTKELLYLSLNRCPKVTRERLNRLREKRGLRIFLNQQPI